MGRYSSLTMVGNLPGDCVKIKHPVSCSVRQVGRQEGYPVHYTGGTSGRVSGSLNRLDVRKGIRFIKQVGRQEGYPVH